MREPALLQSHWCENQHCYSRTGAKTSTVTVALVREPALLQLYWCENQHCCRRTGARTSTIAEQYWSLSWDRQAVTDTLRAALTTRHGTSARPVLMVMQGKKPIVVVQQKWRTAPALRPTGWVVLAPLTGTTPVILGLMSDMSACSFVPETSVWLKSKIREKTDLGAWGRDKPSRETGVDCLAVSHRSERSVKRLTIKGKRVNERGWVAPPPPPPLPTHTHTTHRPFSSFLISFWWHH